MGWAAGEDSAEEETRPGEERGGAGEYMGLEEVAGGSMMLAMAGEALARKALRVGGLALEGVGAGEAESSRAERIGS